jgi:hypothetical protein
LLLGLVALVNAGCLAVAVGAGAAGAAAAGYMYCNGLLYRDYPASITDSTAAVRTALAELQFPILKDTNDTGTAFLRTRTGDGHTVRIYLDVMPSAIPVEGIRTRVAVRVGFSGDTEVSARILDQVSRHLLPPTGVPAPPPALPPGSAVVLPPRPVPETAAPPLAAPAGGR